MKVRGVIFYAGKTYNQTFQGIFHGDKKSLDQNWVCDPRIDVEGRGSRFAGYWSSLLAMTARETTPLIN